jgi:hypothetical protein
VSPVELEMFKTIQPKAAAVRQLGDSFSRTQSAESLLSYPHLIHWTAKAAVNPAYRKALVAKDVVEELVTKAQLYRDLGRIARRKRMLGKSWDAWGGTTGPAAPQRSDLTSEEGEIKRQSPAKQKEPVG